MERITKKKERDQRERVQYKTQVLGNGTPVFLLDPSFRLHSSFSMMRLFFWAQSFIMLCFLFNCLFHLCFLFRFNGALRFSHSFVCIGLLPFDPLDPLHPLEGLHPLAEDTLRKANKNRNQTNKSSVSNGYKWVKWLNCKWNCSVRKDQKFPDSGCNDTCHESKK